MLRASRPPPAVAHGTWACYKDPGVARCRGIRACLGHKHNVPLIPLRRNVHAHSAASLLTLTLDETYDVETSYLSAQIDVLSSVRNQVLGLDDFQQVEQFLELPAVKHVLEDHRDLKEFILEECAADAQAALLATLAAGQEHVLTLRPEGDWKPQMRSLAEKLVKVQRFYDALGGIVGYQLKCLQLIVEAKRSENDSLSSLECSSIGNSSTSSSDFEDFEEEVEYLVPQGPKFNKGAEGRALAVHAAGQGLRALPELAEIYPLGGAGDRLGLVCDETGEPLPAAMLPYCGRPLLEGLIRDLTAREYLYYRTFGEQCTTPVAIMTSDAKGNHWRVRDLLKTRNYFGRPKDSFRLFCQPLVPVLEASTGVWVLPEALTPSMKPGGHGAIWKLMHDNGIFSWLQESGRTAATIRQISNPMAATDCTLLALAGTGHEKRRSFGFASCNRAVGASEGMNVLRRRKMTTRLNGSSEASVEFEYGVTNVEYTEFTRLGIEDKAAECGTESAFPANTNILYVGLEHAHEVVLEGIRSGTGGASLPGIIFNLNKQITYTPASPPGTPPGTPRTVHAGRMECTMQNLADALTYTTDRELSEDEASELSTFVVFNDRRYVTSSAKRKLKPDSLKVAQTPEGSFLDLMRNASDLLCMAGVHVPDVNCTETYLNRGCRPAFQWLWNPALGPLWTVVAQKVAGGSLAEGSEVELEIAELRWKDVHVDGSLLIHAENIVGSPEASGSFRFSHEQAGRVRLEDSVIKNLGIDCSAAQNGSNSEQAPKPCFWKRNVPRAESCRIVLRGRSEFAARGVQILGDAIFEVPDGQCMEVLPDADSACGYQVHLSPLREEPSWRWDYTMHDDNKITLELVETRGDAQADTASQLAAATT